SKVMATTHYGELKVYALETQGVQNASCEFDTNTLMPTYKIIMGVPGKSNAFYISKRLGIDDDIIENAKRHLSEDEKRLDGVLAQLEDLKKQLKAGQDEIEMLKDYAGNKMKQAEEKSAKILKEAQAQADAITEKAKLSAQKVQDEAYRLSDELKVLQKQENISAQQRLQKAREIARKDTAKLISSVEKDETDVIALPKVETVKKGDKVVIGSLNKQAVVQGPANKDGMVDVMAGVIKTRVHISDLYQDIAPAPKQKQSGGMRNVRQGTRNNTTSAATRNASMEINVIGQTVDEAIIEVDRFLDNCFMNRQHTVYIIHGKGTGALRSGIHQFLKKHKHVSYFRLGTYGEGEAGVTVVELK
ncbi:MAG: Smr/MutS family protein, partial [Oscillospiraceae bacterium]|nr:Smr/MutS family protein [Oscillospiraceae bacterium]